MYADYVYYSRTYYGTQITECNWDRLATQASDYIDYITLGRAASFVEAHPDSDAVKKCCCALAERYQRFNNARNEAMSLAESGPLQSESVGEYSRTYRDGASATAEIDQLEQAELRNVATQYLLATGLLYRGGISCVHSAHCHGI